MLVVDLDACGAVCGLNFLCDIFLNALHALCTEHILRIDRTFGERIARADGFALCNEDICVVRNRVRLGFSVGTRDGDFTTVVGNMHDTVVLGDDRFTFRIARFEQFFDTRQTLRDIVVGCDAARVEGTHRQLRARLAD